MLKRYKGKKILIAGFGLEGRTTFEYLRKHGIQADIADANFSVIPAQAGIYTNKTLDSRFRGNDNTKLILGKNYLDSVTDYDVIFRSPGISCFNPELVEAKKGGVEVTSQTRLFMEICPCKTIGITGTKGKGTASSLIYEALKASGKDVFLGGNIGVPPITFVDKLQKDSIAVLEFSSFQLMDLDRSPNIAVVLNITQDHIDVHANREEYVDAKKSVVQYQTEDDFAVINIDYETPNSFRELTKGQIWWVSTLSPVIPAPDRVEGKAPAGIQKGIDSRLRGNDRGGYGNDENDRNDNIGGGCYVNKNDDIILSTEESEEKIASFSELQLRGRHNLENVCAAVAAAYLGGAGLDSIREIVKNFQGLEHRLEFVAEIGGVKYYNDSFATTPETTIAALKSFDNPIILIAGGSDKGADYKEMGRVIANKAKTVFLIGAVSGKIKKKILRANPQADIIEGYKDMNDLLERINKIAIAGDVVLLSPGCASFGLFKNYKERGELFKEAVAKLIRN